MGNLMQWCFCPDDDPDGRDGWHGPYFSRSAAISAAQVACNEQGYTGVLLGAMEWLRPQVWPVDVELLLDDAASIFEQEYSIDLENYDGPLTIAQPKHAQAALNALVHKWAEEHVHCHVWRMAAEGRELWTPPGGLASPQVVS